MKFIANLLIDLSNNTIPIAYIFNNKRNNTNCFGNKTKIFK